MQRASFPPTMDAPEFWQVRNWNHAWTIGVSRGDESRLPAYSNFCPRKIPPVTIFLNLLTGYIYGSQYNNVVILSYTWQIGTAESDFWLKMHKNRLATCGGAYNPLPRNTSLWHHRRKGRAGGGEVTQVKSSAAAPTTDFWIRHCHDLIAFCQICLIIHFIQYAAENIQFSCDLCQGCPTFRLWQAAFISSLAWRASMQYRPLSMRYYVWMWIM